MEEGNATLHLFILASDFQDSPETDAVVNSRKIEMLLKWEDLLQWEEHETKKKRAK